MEQSDLLRLAIAALERLTIPYAIVGSMASSAWGESRFTQDIDIVIQVDREAARRLCDAFGSDAFYVSRAAAQSAVDQAGQFNVLHPLSGNKIDFMISGGSKWSESQFARRRRVQLGVQIEGYVAAPEDVILGKLIYYNDGGSEKHLRDITGILTVSGKSVDREYIANFAQQLGVADAWKRVSERVSLE